MVSCVRTTAILLIAAAAGAEPADDHGDTRLTATLVGHYGVSVAGTLGSSSDVDVFRLDLQGRAEVEMRSSGELDARGTLYDSDGAVIAEDDDAGTDMNFRIVTTLPGGVYYVAVASDVDTGSYKMTARIRRAGDDHGGTSGASTFLPLGIRTTGRISPAGDTDAFRLEVPNAGGLRVGSSGPADTVGELRDSAGAVLAVRDDGGHGHNFRIERHVEPGIYYVHVSAATPGSFTLLADVHPAEDPQAVAREVFNQTIYPTIVQAKCIKCHVSGGEADATRLVFETSANSDHRATNFERMRAFVAGADDRTMLVLDKVRGLAGHGGGEQIAGGSPEYADLERFLTLLAANGAPIPDQTLMAGSTLELTVPLAASGDRALDVTSSAPCVVTAEVAGTTLTLTGVVAGTATVTVTASDGGFMTFTATVQPPRRPAWTLPRTIPGDAGIAACTVKGVLDHVFTDRAVQSALLVADGTVIAERYAAGYDVASLGTSWSVAKSFYSAAIGVAIDQGHIASLDQRASDFFTEWAGTNKASITVRDLLEMRAGLPDPNIFVQYDQTAFSLAQEPVRARGTTFQYSNITSQLFEPLIRRATGMDAHDWLAETILEPIGIDRGAIGMWLDPTGTQPLTYCCLDMRPDDFARFGVLFASGGDWEGERLITEDYVQTSLSAQSPFYGLQWWVMNGSYFEGVEPPIAVSAAHGLEGQHIYVWPDGNIVLVVLTRYEHDRSQGYVLSLENYPSTCAGRNSCPGAQGTEVPSYSERTLLERLAALR
ncbi:MAG: serine hydrolase [Gammaproteobacteria bacterium]|nr:serine hydrolase [Gammaproteobacteria bacterium]